MRTHRPHDEAPAVTEPPPANPTATARKSAGAVYRLASGDPYPAAFRSGRVLLVVRRGKSRDAAPQGRAVMADQAFSPDTFAVLPPHEYPKSMEGYGVITEHQWRAARRGPVS
jgi:hypothetical protein